MQYRSLSYELRDGVAVLTLDREARLNALDSHMNRELPHAWRRFAEDPDARVAIVTGRGAKAFCVGGDLTDMPQDEADPAFGTVEQIRWASLQNRVWKPVICAVNGMVSGGGLHFVAEADIVLAASHATFFDSHVAVGLVSALEPITLARRIPLGSVMRLALLGGSERLDAAEALRIGMVDEVVPADRLLERAFALADKIKRHSPAALAHTKKAIWDSLDRGLHDAYRAGWRHIMAHITHPDVAEGGRAFLERRAPVWQPAIALDDLPEGP
jgi:enoyl-CoA hydratase/carnithine racemase